ncbi:MAG: hypothetical protein M3515_08095 [Actinomycetota bacterium]|nr:hypothetical protein [Actinomycetota bacterium]
MRRSRAFAGGLALACAAASGCGVSSKEITKPRDPAGQGETRGPDVSVEGVDDLRATEVVINRARFQPQQVSIGLDSTVRVVNGDSKTVNVRALEGLGDRLEDAELEPGEKLELDFLDSGTERLALEGSKARLEINVYPGG